MPVPKSRRHRWMRVWRRDRRAACGLRATGGTVGEWTNQVLVVVSNCHMCICCRHGRPDSCLRWAMVGNEGQKTAQGSEKYSGRYTLQDAERIQNSKASNWSPSFPRSTSLCIGKIPIPRADVRPDDDVGPPPADSKEMTGLTAYHSHSGPLNSKSVAGRRLPSSG